jgi:hypothetical protein
MAVTVADIVNNAKRILQEVTADGTRWTNDELAGWLNEFYQAAVGLKPDVSTVNEELALAAGTKQEVPATGLRLIDVIRNTSGKMTGISVTTRKSLDTIRRAWHSDPATSRIEQYVFEDLDPKVFYVYPPAEAGATVEILYSTVPAPHDLSTTFAVYGLEDFKLNDAHAPAATDYILYRAFSKDAETPQNLNRSRMHFQNYAQQLTGKRQADQAYSPNAPDTSANPPRGNA